MSKLIVNQLQAYSGSLITFTDGTSAYISGSLVVVGSTTAASISATTLTGTLSTAAQTNITSVGTLSSLAVSGNLTVDTNTLFVDSSANEVGIGTATPAKNLEIFQATDGATIRISSGQNDSAHSTSTPFGILEYYSFDASSPGASVRSSIGSYPVDTAGSGGANLIFNNSGPGGIFEAMRIDSSGNVGINCTPSYKLDVQGNSATIRVSESGGAEIRTAAGGSLGYFGTYSNHPLTFLTNSTERMRIDSSGNVGIGTASPSKKLDILTTANSSTEYQLSLRNAEGANNVSAGIAFGFNSSVLDPDYLANISSIITNRTTRSADILFSTAPSGTPTERMRIDSSGNVGIGVSSPDTKLEIQSASSAGAALKLSYNSGTVSTNDVLGDILFEGLDVSGGGVVGGVYGKISSIADGNWDTSSGIGAFLAFSTAQYNGTSVSLSERMRITSGGQVKINQPVVDAAEALFLKGIVSDSSQFGFLVENNSTAYTAYAARFLNSATNSVVGSITMGVSATAYNTSSDYRLKEDWIPMEGALDRVDALKPVNFAWKVDGSRVDGFLAHELAEVVPEAVTGEKDATEIRSVEVSPAVYEDVIHPAEEAVYETIEHPAIAEELDEEGNVLVEAQEAWTEEVLVSEAKEEWVEKVLVSEAVFEDQEFPVYQGIDQSKIVPLLVAGLQEAHDLIKELRAEIELLKAPVVEEVIEEVVEEPAAEESSEEVAE